MGTNTEELTVDRDKHVNEATLQLLKMQIESDVKKGFLRSVGAPIGGAGILAILYMLFIWIPDNVGNILRENPRVQDTIQESVADYLADDDRGERYIREQVDATAKPLINSAVKEHLASKAGKEFLQKTIRTQMKTQAVQDQINAAVDRALKPITRNLTSTISNNLGRLVSDISELDEFERFDKQSIENLNRFLESPQASEIRESGKPLVLTKVIRRGQQYEEGAIGYYIGRLGEAFPDQFRHVLIVDRNKEFVALIDSARFAHALDTELMNVLNGDGANLSSEAARQFFMHRFGPKVLASVSIRWPLGEALVKPFWEELGPNQVPVLDDQRQLVGMTNRAKLIAGVNA